MKNVYGWERANQQFFFIFFMRAPHYVASHCKSVSQPVQKSIYPFVNNVQMRVRASVFSESVWESKRLFLMLMLSLSFWHISTSAVYCLTPWCYTSANPLCCSPANDQPASKNPTFLWKNRGKWKSWGLNYGSNDKPAFEDHSSRSVKQSY